MAQAQESRWKGMGVSEGLVVGRVLRMHDGSRYVYRARIEQTEIERELRRLRAAVRLARRQLLAIKRRAEKELGKDAYIFDAHLLLLKDKRLIGDVESCIVQEHVNAEWALKVIGDRLLSVYSEIKDDYLRERGSDIEDVVRRLMVALSGERPPHRSLTEDAVIVSKDLLPSTVAELDLKHVRAVATDTGGWTSHTAIIARGLGIPAVVGLRDFYRRTRTGDQVIIDSTRSEVILHPSPETLELYVARVATPNAPRSLEYSKDVGPVRTRDGVEIRLRANVELPGEFPGVKIYGAQGVGLYRSEFLLSRPGVMVSEEQQYAAYSELAEIAGEAGAIVRLFDLGGGKTEDPAHEPEQNPALGLRAIRYSLRHQEIMRTQVRAILRAAVNGHLDIVLPMVTDVTDVRRAREIIKAEEANLANEGIRFGVTRIGAMIEVPSAVFTSARIARLVDFFQLGTNDLIQYTLVVDRTNEEVADWFRTLHPAVLEAIDQTLSSAREAGIPAIVCGEMASTPAYAVLLVGLGAVDLSMTPSTIPGIRRAVSGIDYQDARRIAQDCLECETADDVEALVRERFLLHWPELFPPNSLPAPRKT